MKTYTIRQEGLKEEDAVVYIHHPDRSLTDHSRRLTGHLHGAAPSVHGTGPLWLTLRLRRRLIRPRTHAARRMTLRCDKPRVPAAWQPR